MPALLSEIGDPREGVAPDAMAPDMMEHDPIQYDRMRQGPTGAVAQSAGHRLIRHAREALAAGDELVAVLMLRLAYEAFDPSDRREAA